MLVAGISGCIPSRGVPIQLTKIEDDLTPQAISGNPEAQYRLALSKSGLVRINWLRKAAMQGHVKAQFDLGKSYADGYNVKKNRREAIRWFLEAAKQGHRDAQFELGFCYELERQYSKAMKWYAEAAMQGLTYAEEQYLSLEERGFRPENDIPVKPLTVATDVDSDSVIPGNPQDADDTFVLVIANENYSKAEVANVRYAQNDGTIFAKYAKKTLGVPARNVTLVTNATAGKMRSMEKWLRVRVKHVPNAKVIYYYAGHGVPVVSGGRIERTCLLPTDINVADAEDAGIDTQELFERLSQMEAKQVAVFLDACFSGMTRDDKPQFAARGVRLKAKSTAPRGNMVVFSAASGDQTALPSKGSPHGIFTHNLLLALQRSKGKVSYGELAKFLKKEVPLAALDIHNREQTPTVEVSGDFDMNQKLVE